MAKHLPPGAETGIILAAGKNTRFDTGIPKTLQKLGSTTLLERQIHQLREAGIRNIAIVVGHRGEMIETAVQDLNRKHGALPPVEIIWNHQFERPNAWSILSARDWVKMRNRRSGAGFLCTMADHVFEDRFFSKFLSSAGDEYAALRLAVDQPGDHNRHIDLEDVTRVLVRDTRIVAIGKLMENWNYFDTGCFLIQNEFFDVIDRAISIEGEGISDAVRMLASTGRAYTVDLSGVFWSDVDTPADFERTLRILAL